MQPFARPGERDTENDDRTADELLGPDRLREEEGAEDHRDEGHRSHGEARDARPDWRPYISQSMIERGRRGARGARSSVRAGLNPLTTAVLRHSGRVNHDPRIVSAGLNAPFLGRRGG